LLQDVVDRDSALVERHVRVSAVAGDVAHRPQAFRGTAVLVDRDGVGVRVQPDGLQPDVGEVGAPSGRHQQVVDPHVTRPGDEGEPRPVVLDPRDLRPGADLDALLAQHPGHDLGGLRLLGDEDALRGLEEGDPGAEPGEGLRELAADVAGAEDRQRGGRLLDLEHLAVGPVRRAVQARDRGDGRSRPGVQHHAPPPREHQVAVLGRDPHPPGTVEVAVAAHHPHALVLHRPDVAVVVPVVGRLADACRRSRECTPLAGGVDQQLGGGAAPERALTAHEALLDGRHLQPGASQPPGGVLPS
jgi:hypothetical protein